MSESAQISSLELEVQSNATGAKKSLDSLISTLNKLKTASKSARELQSVSEKLRAISSSASSEGVKNLSSLVGSLEKLGAIGSLKISSSVANQLKEITSAVKAMNGVSFSQITNLSASLSHLNNVKKGNLGTVLNQLKKVPDAVAGLNAIDQTTSEKVRQLVGSLSQLSSIPKNNLSGIVNSMAKIPKVVDELDDSKLDQFDQKIKKITSSLQPLATQLSAIKGSFSVLTNGVNRANSATNKMSGTFRSSSTSVNVLGEALKDVRVRLVTTYIAARSVATVISGWINESTKYVEDLNLFTVAMGEYAQEAQAYAETVSQVMGIDPAQWMRNQGVFMTLATGFGVASDRAELMSRNLTQLGYDISSFFNISVDEAMTKLQSGISGELEPLRRLGYDLSDARLQATALSLGIDESTQSMDQAEKAQLRYYAIMTQVTTAQGDMARTLEAPANQLRILQAQLTQAARALGNIFIPALNAGLPYAIAFLRAVREIADAIAELFGYTLPEIDYSGIDNIGSSAAGATDSVEGTTDAVKELQKTIASFDELHILSDNTNDSVSVGTGTDGNEFDFPLPEYDFLGDVVSTRADEIFESIRPQVEWIKDHLDDILDVATLIGGVFLAWKFAKGFTSAIQTLSGLGKTLGLNTVGGSILKTGLGISLGIVGFSFEADGAYHIGYGDADVMDYVKTAIGAALGVAGSLLVFGTGPVGWTVGLGIALTTFLVNVATGDFDRRVKEDLARRFGDIVLTQDEIDAWAKELTTSELTYKLDLFVDEQDTLNQMKESLDDAAANLRGYMIKSQIGVDIDKEEFISAIDNYIAEASDVIDQSEITGSIAVELLLDDNEFGTQFLADMNLAYENYRSRLEEAGAKWKEAISTGFQDGEWIPEKEEQARQAMEEINEIMQQITSAGLEAKLQSLSMDANGTDLTPESFQSIMQSGQEAVNEQIEQLKQARETAIQNAWLTYGVNGDTEGYQNALDEIEAGYQDAFAELNERLGTFGAETLADAYSDEINNVLTPVFSASLNDIVGNTNIKNFSDVLSNGADLTWYLDNVRSEFERELSADVSSETRENAAQMISSVAEVFQNNKTAAWAALSAGEQIPESLRQGLTDYYQVAALSGDAEAINFLLGQKFSTDSSFLNTLATVEGAGSQMPDAMRLGFLATSQPVIDEAGNLINGVTGETILTASQVTETLKQNLADMGWSAGSSYSSNIASAAGSVDGGEIANNVISELQRAQDAVRRWMESNNISSQDLENRYRAQFEYEQANAYNLYGYFPDWLKDFDDWKKHKNITTYASGGYPPAGEMFIAREAGPELVGRIGNRTAVANNDQITAAISSAVYAAIVNAKASGGVSEDALYRAISRALSENNSDIVMQVDSEELYRASMNGKQKYGKRHNAMVEVL